MAILDQKRITIEGNESWLRNLQANISTANPRVAAVMHFYPRSGKYASNGFMTGVGAGFQSTLDINLSVYLGATAILGKQRKSMVSGGVSYLKVDKLKKPEFEVDNLYDPLLNDVTKIIEKTFLSSAFLAVSFNLTNRVEVN